MAGGGACGIKSMIRGEIILILYRMYLNETQLGTGVIE